MKAMIEVDIPAGKTIADAQEAVKRAFDADWMARWWHIDDIIEEHDRVFCGEITQDDAREVLRLMNKYHDCGVGINWDVIDSWIDHIKELGRKTA